AADAEAEAAGEAQVWQQLQRAAVGVEGGGDTARLKVECEAAAGELLGCGAVAEDEAGADQGAAHVRGVGSLGQDGGPGGSSGFQVAARGGGGGGLAELLQAGD